MHRLINEIANDIGLAWQKPYFGAVPYLNAMRELETIDDSYGQDSAKSIITYFLANASAFRGNQAKQFKNELKQILK